jgi:hypothetical protein
LLQLRDTIDEHHRRSCDEDSSSPSSSTSEENKGHGGKTGRPHRGPKLDSCEYFIESGHLKYSEKYLNICRRRN